VLVAPDFDIASAARTAIGTKCCNAGQMCTGVDYVLVPRGRAQAFADASAAYMRERWGGGSLCDHEQWCAMLLGDREVVRLRRMLDEAHGSGARLLSLDPAGRTDALANSHKFPLTLVLPPDGGVLSEELEVMREEIFGPLLPVVEYGTVEEAVATINKRPRPLAFYPFTNDPKTLDLVLQRVVAGGATVNGCNVHPVPQGLPFGGVGQSGCGAYHGKSGFANFSHSRATFVVERPALLPNTMPPLSSFDTKLIELSLRDPPPFRLLLLSLAALSLAGIAYSRRRGVANEREEPQRLHSRL
jgi:coniferyl-aldehyde dehydrogenase